jgi:hypothetical protein
LYCHPAAICRIFCACIPLIAQNSLRALNSPKIPSISHEHPTVLPSLNFLASSPRSAYSGHITIHQADSTHASVVGTTRATESIRMPKTRPSCRQPTTRSHSRARTASATINDFADGRSLPPVGRGVLHSLESIHRPWHGPTPGPSANRYAPETLSKLTDESYETLDKQYREFLEKGEKKQETLSRDWRCLSCYTSPKGCHKIAQCATAWNKQWHSLVRKAGCPSPKRERRQKLFVKLQFPNCRTVGRFENVEADTLCGYGREVF